MSSQCESYRDCDEEAEYWTGAWYYVGRWKGRNSILGMIKYLFKALIAFRIHRVRFGGRSGFAVFLPSKMCREHYLECHHGLWKMPVDMGDGREGVAYVKGEIAFADREPSLMVEWGESQWEEVGDD